MKSKRNKIQKRQPRLSRVLVCSKHTGKAYEAFIEDGFQYMTLQFKMMTGDMDFAPELRVRELTEEDLLQVEREISAYKEKERKREERRAKKAARVSVDTKPN